MTYDYTKDAERLAWIMSTISSVPEGADLVARARLVSKPVFFNAALNNGPEIHAACINYYGRHVEIALNPYLPDDQLVQVLACQLRTLLQPVNHHMNDVTSLTPVDQMIVGRLLKGDAAAFSAMLVHKINTEADKNLPCHVYGASRAFNQSAWHPDQLRLSVFESYQKDGNRDKRDRDLLAHVEKEGSGPASFADIYNKCADMMAVGNTTYLEAPSSGEFARRMALFIKPATLVYARQMHSPHFDPPEDFL